ncbi:MAG: ABC transporter ATP-binding protein [Eubacteriales bacterium]|nr:ABC transporter ATP-binding protein [Eubacteriales bacterium]
MKKTDYGKPYRTAAFRGNRLTFAGLLTTTVSGAVLQAVIAVFLQLVLDSATGAGPYGVKALGVLCLVLMAAFGAVTLAHREVATRFLRRANRQYRKQLFDDLTRKNITAFSREQSGIYISMLTADANTVEEKYFRAMSLLVMHTLNMALSLGLMFFYNWLLALVSLALTALVMLCSTVLGGRMEQAQRRVSDRSSSFVAGVKDLLSGFSVIKSFQAERETQKIFAGKNDALEQAKFVSGRLERLAEFLSGGASFAMQMAVFLLGAVLALRGAITVGVILVFVQLTGMVANSVGQLAGMIPAFRAARGLIDKAGQTLLANTSEKQGTSISTVGSGIACRNLHFGYEADSEILKGVDIDLEAGKSYALVGASGSGKSTLLNLLLGSYPDYTGSITVGGAELNEVSTESLYDLMALVQQNVFVFDSTIEENITMFKSFPETAIQGAIRRSGLGRLIEEKGRDYRCGENGCNLSGGERQRISIARCLLKNTQVLMLDEATAALDAQTSANVTNAILDVEGLTRIIVTHKLESAILERFDKILVLRDGTIAEQGTFRDLLEKNGYFAALYKVSTGL